MIDFITILGFAAAIVIGITLGLIGGGGSILTVPVLVYLLNVDVVLSTAYSLFIVGIASLFGVYGNYKKGQIDFKTGIVFGIPAVISVFATRHYLIPALPDVLFTVGAFTVSKELAMMLLFGILMIVASYSMIKKQKEKTSSSKKSLNYPVILLEGLVVGMLTGMVGAGGGFIIIPALVLLSGLPMKTAVGTSLFIISAKSLIGFLGDLGNASTQIDWIFLLSFSVLAVLGIFFGNWLSNYVSSKKLKPAFGYFVLAMGLFVLIDRLFIQ